MMHLVLTRTWRDAARTLGTLAIDGVGRFSTLEDTVRPAGEKIAGRTAIPAGHYAVRLTMSARFGRLLPILIGDADFETAWRGVRIHRGNTEADTEGCILVGRSVVTKPVPRLLNSGAAEIDLVETLRRALSRGETIALDIVEDA